MDLETIKQEYPEIEVGRAENLKEKIFNHWRVLYRTTNRGDKKVMWVCQCDCEKKTIKPVSAASLKNNTSTNCGCERQKTIENKANEKIRKFNDLGQLTHKKCFRCGEWLTLDRFWKNATQKDGYSNECIHCYNSAKENRYNIYKKGAKKRNLDFQLSKEEFYAFTFQPCYYCGELQEYNGIDRIDSNQGYLNYNCVPCCEKCNKMKLDYTLAEWYSHMRKILTYSGEIL